MERLVAWELRTCWALRLHPAEHSPLRAQTRQTSLLDCFRMFTSFPSIMLEMLENSDSRKGFRTARSAWGLNTAVEAACWHGIRSWLARSVRIAGTSNRSYHWVGNLLV
jgi:hypothetical protein